jgi:hypothetical protein
MMRERQKSTKPRAVSNQLSAFSMAILNFSMSLCEAFTSIFPFTKRSWAWRYMNILTNELMADG